MVIRVLQITGILNYGGIEKLVLNLQSCMDKNRIQFDYVVHGEEKGVLENDAIEMGSRIFHCPKYTGKNHFAYVHWWKTFFNEHREYTIIHSHIRSTASLIFREAKKHRIITIAHSHAIATDGKGFEALVKNYYQSKLQNIADYRFACSNAAGKWLFPSKPFTLVKNGIFTKRYIYNTTIREKVREKYGIDERSLVIGTVGRFDNRKNPFGIIEIFKNVVYRSPDAKLLWIGDGEIRERIVERIEKENLMNKVILTGFKSNVSDFLQAMDVFLLPSFEEGFPIVSIEAQASGLPCLLSDRIPEDIMITDLCKRLPLGDYGIWADYVMTTWSGKRSSPTAQIIASGFDIMTTAEWMDNFYMRCCSNEQYC